MVAFNTLEQIKHNLLKHKQQRWRWRGEGNIQGRWTPRLINTCKTVRAGWLSRWKRVSGHEPHATTFHRHVADQHCGTGPQAKLVPDNSHINNQLQATCEGFKCIQRISKSFNNLTFQAFYNTLNSFIILLIRHKGSSFE